MKRLSVCSFVLMASLLLCCSDNKKNDQEHASNDKQEEVSSAPVGQALFLQHCAGCHGKDGDGKGETKLKSPARSFAAGGFAFGNTVEAMYKTVTNGMPGQSEMPSFKEELTDEERRQVVTYVRTLIPNEKQVNDTATIMVVKDRPLIFRGILPSLGNKLPQRPRGMLIGLQDGTTFEYRTDDVRLLAVRTGGFVKRTDWTGRGGVPAKPTGKIRHLIGGGDPEPLFWAKQDGKLVGLKNKMKGTFAFTDMAGASYEVQSPDGKSATTVKEAPFGQNLKDDFGYGRRFLIGPTDKPLFMKLSSGSEGQTWYGRPEKPADSEFAPVESLRPMVRKSADESALIVALKDANGVQIKTSDNDLVFKLATSKDPRDIQFIFIHVEKYDVDNLAELAGKVIWQ